MRSQHEKNKDFLHEKIEEYCNRPMTDSVAEHLSVYRGALEAFCMKEKGWEENPTAVESYATKTAAEEKPARTPELDGDTELEQVFMRIPADAKHMKAIFDIFADHMEQLAIVNQRAHKNIMLKLQEVART